MLQVPNLPAYQLPQPSYNAVKIDIHNPSVNGASCPIQRPMQMPVQQPTMPLYDYPQAQVYGYPQAVQQPYYVPTMVNTQPVNTQEVAPVVNQAPCPPCPVCPAPQATAVPNQQININQAPQVADVKVEKNEQEKPVEIQQPIPAMPSIDVNAFLAKLADSDFEVQANTMEQMANMVKENPQLATELLDARIIDSLINITKVDSSKLAGPTQEQSEIRAKLLNGQNVTEQEKALATTITPMEQAERNKSYAMFTTAILDKLYGDEILKLTGKREPLITLPGASAIVDQLKDNPNPLVRSSAIDAMSYLQTPEYKKDLTTLFTIAQKDSDKGVQETAKTALDKLNQI